MEQGRLRLCSPSQAKSSLLPLSLVSSRRDLAFKQSFYDWLLNCQRHWLLPPCKREADRPPHTSPGGRRARPRAAPLRRPGALPPFSQRRRLTERERNKLSAASGAGLSPSPEVHVSTWTGSPGIGRCGEAMRPFHRLQGPSGGEAAHPRSSPAPRTQSASAVLGRCRRHPPLSHRSSDPSRRRLSPPAAACPAPAAPAPHPAPPPAPP